MVPRDKIMYSFVREVDGEVTDFFSFYSLPSHVLNNPKHTHIYAAYNYYYFNSSLSVKELIQNLLIQANLNKFDVVNCVDIMESAEYLTELHFSQGGGFLKYYLFNWNLGEPVHHKDLGMILF